MTPEEISRQQERLNQEIKEIEIELEALDIAASALTK